ncbi:MAG: hypothetical protein RL181_2377 [Bacteroidota bacterium]|jgi:hypothetical protein
MKKMWRNAIVVLLGWGPFFASGQSITMTSPAEFRSVDGVIGVLYQVISGPAGQRRDWNTFRALFRPEARLNALGKDREGNPRFNTMAIEDYIRNTGPNFEQNGFFEREIGRVSEQYGDMVHVLSTYESRREEQGEVFSRGINSIQLIQKDGRFWIVNILWNSETPDNPIPAKYLGKH